MFDSLSKPLAGVISAIFCIIFISGAMDAGQNLRVGWSRDAGSLADRESGLLAARLGSNIGVSVKTVRFDRVDALEDALEKGVIDIAVWPDYVLLKDRVFFRRLAVLPLRKADRKTWLYVIEPVSSSGDTGIKSTSGVAGKRLRCYFLPPGAGITGDQVSMRLDEVRNAVNGVANGRIDAISISSNLLAIMERTDPDVAQRVRIVERIPVKSSLAIVSGPSLPEGVAKKIKMMFAGAKKQMPKQAVPAAAETPGPVSPVSSIVSPKPAAPEPLKPVDNKPPGDVRENPARSETMAEKTETKFDASGEMKARQGNKALVNIATLLTALIAGSAVLLLGIKWLISRRQALIVVSLSDRFEACQLISLKECNAEVRLCAAAGDIRPGIDEERLKNLIYQAGFRKGVRFVSVIDSDTGRTRSYSMPWLKRNEIYPAVTWKLKEDNIPYDPKRDVITYIVWRRLKASKGMDILVSILDKWDIERVQDNLGRMPDMALCTEAALSAFVQCAFDQETAVFYRISAEKAVMLFYHPSSGVFTRRLFAPGSTPEAAYEACSSFPGQFKDELIQTVQLYERRFSRRLKTVHVAGYALRPADDKDMYPVDMPVDLPDRIEHLEIKALDAAATLKDKTGLTGDFLFMPLAAGAFFAALKQTGGGGHDTV